MQKKHKFTRAEWNSILRDLRRIYGRNDEREFMRILRQRGIKDEDPRFSEIVQLFRDLKRGKVS
jgi:wyosine [tRNA(Phe)-imidazoG37] synthetase (radical SAM superfamily)